MDLLLFPPTGSEVEKRLRRTKYLILCPGSSISTCKVISIIRSSSRENYAKIVRVFRHIMDHGLPLYNKRKAEYVKGTKVIELKAGSKNGTKVRVFCFRDGHRIICVEANASKTNEKPDPFVRRVEEFMSRYFEQKKKNKVAIIEPNA